MAFVTFATHATFVIFTIFKHNTFTPLGCGLYAVTSY